MLVLKRKLSERIFIGPDIRITVIETQSGSVRLGIEAPEAVAIMREELTPTDDVRRKPKPKAT